MNDVTIYTNASLRTLLKKEGQKTTMMPKKPEMITGSLAFVVVVVRKVRNVRFVGSILRIQTID